MKIFENPAVDVVAKSILKEQEKNKTFSCLGIMVDADKGVSYLTDFCRLLIVSALPLVSIPSSKSFDSVLRIIPSEDQLFALVSMPKEIQDIPTVSRRGKLFVSFLLTACDGESVDLGPTWFGIHKDRHNFDAAILPASWPFLRLNKRIGYPAVAELGALARLVIMPVTKE